MSGKESSVYDPLCTSGASKGYHNLTSPETLSFKSNEKCDSKYSDSGVWSGTNIHSEENFYESSHSDSGVLSGSNIYSEEVHNPDSSRCPKTKIDLTNSSNSNQVSGDKNPTYMRLDSGIDVSQHLSELSLKDNDSYNDLSGKGKVVNSLESTNSASNVTTSTKSSNSPYTASDLSLLSYCYQQNEDGDTDLHLAIVHMFIETVFALVRLVPHPTYLNIRNNDRQTPLHLAVLTRQPRLVRLLVTAGASLDELDRRGNTALHLAVEDHNMACVQAIITPVTVPETYQAQLQYTPCFSNKIIANIYNYEGLTCLHLAAWSGSLDIFKHLLWSGADINAKEWKGGHTCLHMAVERKNVELCMFLLSQERMDPDETSYAGYTAYQTACCGGWDKAIAEILRRHGVDTYYESESESEDDDDDDELESGYNCLKVNGLVDVGA